MKYSLLRSADLRSFDETTVQAVTKSMHLCFEKVEQSITNEVIIYIIIDKMIANILNLFRRRTQ